MPGSRESYGLVSGFAVLVADEEAASDGQLEFAFNARRSVRLRGPRFVSVAPYAAAVVLGLFGCIAVLHGFRSWKVFIEDPPPGEVQRLDVVEGAIASEAESSLFLDCDPEADGENPCKPKTLDDVEKDLPDLCSWSGQNCSATRCCRNAGLQCYQQDETWAECKAACARDPDPVHWNGKNWSCKELGPRAEGSVLPCSEPGEDCSTSGCCKTPGTQCFEKFPGAFATCKAACTEGIDLTDANSDPWTCKTLGPPAKVASSWVAKQCAAAGADCRDARCCAEAGTQCYLRDAYWGQCMSNCTEGAASTDSAAAWECKAVGVRTPRAAAAPPTELAPWVATTCARADENCGLAECCADPGLQCYQKNSTFARCQASCKLGPDLYSADPGSWTCKTMGPRTPGVAEKQQQPTQVADWVATECAAKGASCESSMCCRDSGLQCYTKEEGWATCLSSCTPGENRTKYGDVDGKPWACKELGIRTPRKWGSPSLFCWAVTRVEGYEPSLIKDQLKKNAGIFACDQYAVFSSASYRGTATAYWHPKHVPKQPLVSINLGMGPLGPVKTIAFEPTYVGKSMDNTAGNTELFLRVWEKVKESGLYLTTDWTIKVDPDAVMIVPRMRSILREFTGMSTYIVNCNKPGMVPMMFGSVEVFSRKSLVTFFAKQDECLTGLGWQAWGEDYFMGKCLDMLGVTKTDQFSMVSDGVCKGVNCADPDAAVFHPKKDSDEWMACFDQATAATVVH